MEEIIPSPSHPAQRCTMIQVKLLLNLREDEFSIHKLIVFSKRDREHRFELEGV